MTNVRYTDTQRLKALEVFDRTQSATKAVRELGYPGRWTLHRWIRERDEPPAAPIRRTTLKRYPLGVKLKAVELFTAGMSPDAVASELSLNSKMSVYAWAQRFREEGRARPPESGHGGFDQEADFRITGHLSSNTAGARYLHQECRRTVL
ncbi:MULTISPECIES: terminase gpP N-terminus-related DNA-binding protein [Corynebacterium]|nr:transposase [Corynebacterium striatum]HAT1167758.1 transposase [Corynebacterium striatum]HAT1172030.1 transposase [Corynebacterium striatum]HAT1173423.1 transposase [Corynebacterium striatum]HAT1177187.1 transposase [Corynebacterium striatum]